jgi:protein ImuA
MSVVKADIIAQLKRDILPLQGFKSLPQSDSVDVGLGPIKHSFPNATFPLGSVHEFCCVGEEDAASTTGFIAGILGTLMKAGGVSLWISSSRTIFPPALKTFGIDPDRIIFIDLRQQKDVLWAIEETLKCEGVVAVIGEVPELSFNVSRRLQLAVEQSRVTGFIIRVNSRNLNTTACVTRWKITHLPSEFPGDMPGVSFPRWNVELLKVRNGKPGEWQVEWKAGKFRHDYKLTTIHLDQKKKTG